MTTMLKRITALTLSAGLLFSLSGCGILGGGGTVDNPPGGDPHTHVDADKDDYCDGCGSYLGDGTFGDGGGDNVTVRFYSFNSADVNAQLNKDIQNDFNKKYPNIKIQTNISTDSFYTNVLTDFAAGTEADVFGMEPGEIYPFLQAGYLEPLDSYFEASELVNIDDIWDINRLAYAYDPATKTFGTGKTYAVLKDWTTDSMLLYNRALFTKEQLAVIEKDANGDGISDPLTFDAFKTLCEGLVKSTGGNISQYSFLPGLNEAKVLAQFLTNAGLSWFDPTTYESTFNTAAVQEVMNYYYNILGINQVDNVGSTPYPLFAQGKVAMTMGGLYCINAYNLDKLDLGVAYPPVKNADIECKPYTTGCVGFAVSSRSRVKDAAFKFIEWYLDFYGEQDARNCNNFPAIQKYATEIMLDSTVNTNKVRYNSTKVFYDSLPKAVVIDRNPYCSQASLENIEFTYAGEYLQGAMSLSQFCETIHKEVNKRVKQNKG